MKIRINKSNVNTVVLSLLIFSATALWTTQTATLYIVITAICALYCLLRVFSNLSLANTLINSRFIWWFSLILIVFSIDAVFRARAAIYNYDFQLFTWLSLLMVMILLIDNNGEQEMINMLCSASAIAAVGICFYIILTDFGVSGDLPNRIGKGLSGNVITVAMYLGHCSIGILYKFLRERRLRYLILLIIVTIFMLLTGSKLVFFTFLCEIIMYIQSSHGTKRFKRQLFIIVLLFLGLLIVFTNERLYSAIGARTIDFLSEIGLLKGVDANRSNSTIIRVSLIKTAITCFFQSPIWGGGFGTVAAKPPFYMYSHCNFLEMLACYGILGFLMFYSMHIFILRKIKKARADKMTHMLLVVFVLNVLFNDLTQITYSAGWMNYFGLIVTAAYLTILKQKETTLCHSKAK